ncbi:DUF4350 domain-containing protein [Halorientalis pallida]|uniref:GATase domain protein n=1 Tax=Halorientalis pallida TaxID=2479928 RepID=A0A498KYW5_9EURY|nr:DUF4350 domain-containing protein [Halorientalis pallida]RXK50559.1 hypothetical protein EAF64_08410 [Halorientalis pallida]
MARTDLLKGIGVFAVVVVVIVAATVATGTLLSNPSTDGSVDAPAYDDQLLPTAVDDDGSVGAPDGDGTKTVVIDKSHGNALSESEMQPFVDALVRDGHDVRFYTGGTGGSGGFSGGLSSGSSGLNATLRSADAFVVANPASSYTTGEINGLDAFAEAGGRVLLLADPVDPSTGGQSVSIPNPLGTSTGSTVTPGQPTNLAANFGVSFGAGYLFDMTDNANNFQRLYAQPSGDSSLTEGVDRIVLDDATPLATSSEGTAVVESQDAQLSSTRRGGTYTVAAQTGNVVTIGDTNFLEPASATVADNEAFLTNLAEFLVNGDKEPGAPEAAGPSAGTGTGGFGGPTQPGTTPTVPSNGTSFPTGNGTSP